MSLKYTGRLLAFAVLFVFLFLSLKYWLALENTAKVGAESPDFLLKDIEGNMVKLSDYEEQIIIVFWATWCDSCKSLLETLKDIEDWQIIAINLREKPESVREFAIKDNIPFRVLLDEKGRVADRYNVSGIPETFIIDREGILRVKIPGDIPRELLIEILEEYTP